MPNKKRGNGNSAGSYAQPQIHLNILNHITATKDYQRHVLNKYQIQSDAFIWPYLSPQVQYIFIWCLVMMLSHTHTQQQQQQQG